MNHHNPFDFNSHIISGIASRSKNISIVIMEALISGHWLPGDRINDDELSNTLHVSRISVREALTSLVELRIVEKIHYKGYFVRKLTLEEVGSIIELRMALEELAVRKLLARGDHEIFKEMKIAIDESEGYMKGSNFASYMNTDFKFHELMYEGSGNVWIKYVISDLRLQISLMRNLAMGDDFTRAARASIRDHRLILQQLKSKNKKKAIQLLQKHFNTLYRNIEKAYRQLNHAPSEET